MKQQIEVRIFDPQDVLEATNQSVSEILVIEKCTFPDPWSSGSIEETLKAPGYRNTGAWIEGKLAGYLFCSYVLDETEIVKIAVAPKFQRRGIATALMNEFTEWCKASGIHRWMLDVRAGNDCAAALYRSFGFTEDGVRKNYYTDPVEDAVLMSRQIS